MQTENFQVGIFMLVLLTISLGLWIHVVYHWIRSGWPLAFRLRREVPWRPAEAAIVIVTVLIVAQAGLQQILGTAPDPNATETSVRQTLLQIQVKCLSDLAALALIPLVLSLWHLCYFADYGITRREWTFDLKIAVWGVLLAQLPIRLLEWPIQSLRRQSPHPILELLQSSVGDWQTIAWIALQVVVMAPLIEELVFRVILQGALSRELPPYGAIGLSSLAFVAVHQWVDQLVLLPLAMILGYVYYRRQSYLAVVVLHGLFNGISLILALASLPATAPTP